MSGSHQDTARMSPETVDMSGTYQVAWLGTGVNGHADGVGTVVGGSASGDAPAGVERNGERSPHRVTQRDLQAKLQPVADFRGHGQTEQASGFTQHEIDRFGCNLLGGQNKVPLVFSKFIVHQHNHLSRAKLLESFLDSAKFAWMVSFFFWHCYLIADGFEKTGWLFASGIWPC
jgi:hypothetical protein